MPRTSRTFDLQSIFDGGGGPAPRGEEPYPNDGDPELPPDDGGGGVIIGGPADPPVPLPPSDEDPGPGPGPGDFLPDPDPGPQDPTLPDVPPAALPPLPEDQIRPTYAADEEPVPASSPTSATAPGSFADPGSSAARPLRPFNYRTLFDARARSTGSPVGPPSIAPAGGGVQEESSIAKALRRIRG